MLWVYDMSHRKNGLNMDDIRRNQQQRYEDSREFLVDRIKLLEKEIERLENRIRNVEEHLNIRYHSIY